VRYPEGKIKEAILHPDLDIRDTAIRYFYSSTSPDCHVCPGLGAAADRLATVEGQLDSRGQDVHTKGRASLPFWVGGPAFLLRHRARHCDGLGGSRPSVYYDQTTTNGLENGLKPWRTVETRNVASP